MTATSRMTKAVTAMNPPVGFEADLIRDEKGKVLRTIRQEKNVSPSSNQATYFCGKFYLDNWRWAGVPFYVRTGKRLKTRVTYIYIQFSRPPLKLFSRECENIEPNPLVFVIQPQDEIEARAWWYPQE